MKTILVALAIFSVGFGNSVEAQNQIVKDSLSISEKLGLGDEVVFENYKVKFKTVLTDSRCPKSVMCVRAGEAEVILSVYLKGKFITDKKVRIDASSYVMESNNLAFDAEDFKIYGFSLSPYPDGIGDINDKDYLLEVVFKPKVLE